MEIDVRAVQQKDLEIIKVFVELCERHGLRYFAEGGTCLGAIRHHGYIPWDDDVDMGMPRKDYEAFRDIAKKELPAYLKLRDYRDEPHVTHLFLKIHDTRTTFITNGRNYPDVWTGCAIDIFPYDGYPDSELAAWWLRQRMRFLVRLNRALRLPIPGTRGAAPRLVIGKLLNLFLPWNFAANRLDRLRGKYDMERCKRAYDYNLGRWYVSPADCCLRMEMVPFEDMELPCPADYDRYLTDHYGDWRTLPPEEERRQKHRADYYSLEKSYLTRWWETEEQKKA